MVDVLLTMPDRLLRRLEFQASAAGQTVEEFARDLIERERPRGIKASAEDIASLADEPIVKAAAIEIEARRIGCSFGWRFITCPQRYAAGSKLLLISLNPAGREQHGPPWSQEEGSAYRVESWGGALAGASKLQKQVQALFSLLQLRDEQVFSAHYVPFRSPSWSELPKRDEAEAFSIELWEWLKPTIAFERIVCIGKDKPGRPIARLFGATLEGSLPVGWGSVTADRYRLPDGRPLIALPHLSRFGIFGRTAGVAALRQLFELN